MGMSDYMKERHVRDVQGAPDGTTTAHSFEFEPTDTGLQMRAIIRGPNPPDWSAADISYRRFVGSIRGTLPIDGKTYSVYIRRWFVWGGVRCYYHDETERKLRRPFRWLLPAGFAGFFIRLPAFLRAIILSHSGVWHAPD